VIGTAVKSSQTPAEQVAGVVAELEKPVVETVVDAVVKGVTRNDVQMSSKTSELDALNPADTD
jgi:hypothetical protein